MKGLLFKDIHNTNAGFTLMELLISITIIMAIMTIVGSAFRLGVKAVEKGEENIDEQRRYLTAVNYIYRQLEAVYLNENSVFQGTKDSIQFHMVLNGSIEGDCIKEIIYRLVKSGDAGIMDLEVSQRNVFSLNEEEKNEEVNTLLSGVSDFSLEYLENSSEERVWVDEWKDGQYFPGAVKMKFIYSNRSAVIFVRILKNKKKD